MWLVLAVQGGLFAIGIGVLCLDRWLQRLDDEERLRNWPVIKGPPSR